MEEDPVPDYAALLGKVPGFETGAQHSVVYEDTVICEEDNEQCTATLSFLNPHEERVEPHYNNFGRSTDAHLLVLEEACRLSKQTLDKSYRLHELSARQKRVIGELRSRQSCMLEGQTLDCLGGNESVHQRYSIMSELLEELTELVNETHECSTEKVRLDYVSAEKQKERYKRFAGGLSPDETEADCERRMIDERVEEPQSAKKSSRFVRDTCLEDPPCLDPHDEHLAFILQSTLQMREGDADDGQGNPATPSMPYEDADGSTDWHRRNFALENGSIEDTFAPSIGPRSCAVSLRDCGGQFAQRIAHSGQVSAKYNQLLKPSRDMEEVRKQDLEQILALDLSGKEPPSTCFGRVAGAADHRQLFSVDASEGLAHRLTMSRGHAMSLWTAGMSQNTWTEVQRFLRHGGVSSGAHVFISDGPGGNVFQFVRNVVNPGYHGYDHLSTDRVHGPQESESTGHWPTHAVSSFESNP